MVSAVCAPPCPGGALFERFNYDTEGQLLTGSFMDYLLPTASAVPNITVLHQESPSPLNPLGVKGLGEGVAAMSLKT